MVVLFGMVFIVFGYFVHQDRVPYTDGISTTATVTDVEQRHGDGVTYSAVVTFTTRDNRSVTVTESSSSSIRPHIGAKVKVSYQASDPGGARIIPAHDWVSLICFAAGGLVVLLGLISFASRVVALLFAASLVITAWQTGRKAKREAAARATGAAQAADAAQAPGNPWGSA
jgi:hypothetical protein